MYTAYLRYDATLMTLGLLGWIFWCLLCLFALACLLLRYIFLFCYNWILTFMLPSFRALALALVSRPRWCLCLVQYNTI